MAAIALRVLGPRVHEGFAEADVPWLAGVVASLAKDELAGAEERPAHGGARAPRCRSACRGAPLGAGMHGCAPPVLRSAAEGDGRSGGGWLRG